MNGGLAICRRFLILVLCLSALLWQTWSYGNNSADALPDIEVFVREGCPHCASAKLFLDELRREQPALRVILRDIARDPAGLERLSDLVKHHGFTTLGVPAFYLRGELIIGFQTAETSGARIKALLHLPRSLAQADASTNACRAETDQPCNQVNPSPTQPVEDIQTKWFGELSAQELGLPLFTIAIGLLDGFNPCSMWVLLFMLSLLATLGDRMKMLAIAGTFVAVEGVVYFTFMAAWLNLFLVIGLSRATEIVLGTIAGLAGAINIKDFWAFRRGISLGIPDTAKPGFYAKIRGILQAERLGGAIVGTVVLAVLVQVVELLCTAGFPALYTRILTMHQLEWWAYYGYLSLYNVAYMLDDVLVLGIGLITLSHYRLQEREGRWLKLVSGTVMLGLGTILIAKPEWLTN